MESTIESHHKDLHPRIICPLFAARFGQASHCACVCHYEYIIGVTGKWSTVIAVMDVQVKESGYFTKRFTWLDHLPPYEGPDSLQQLCLNKATIPTQRNHSPLWDRVSPGSTPAPHRRPIDVDTDGFSFSNVTCTCRNCTATLIKLQSLLCSCDARLFAPKLLSILKDASDIQGQMSLQILCEMHANWQTAVDLVLTKHPHIVARVLHETYDADLKVWKYCTAYLISHLDNLMDRDNAAQVDTYKSALDDVFSGLATRLPPDDLVTLVPTNGDLAHYLTFVQKSERAVLLSQLRETILSEARALAEV